MRWWKWLGLAGVIGVAAVGGAAVVQRRRARTWHEYEPEELRARLHERLRSAAVGSTTVATSEAAPRDDA